MIIIEAAVMPLGVLIHAKSTCSGWRHPQREACPPIGAAVVVATDDVERLGMDVALLDGIRSALGESPGLTERAWC